MRRLRAVVANVALGCLSILFCAFLIEATARLLVARDVRAVSTAPLSRYHAALGWDKPPGALGQVRRPEFEVTLSINSRGLRGPERDYAKPAGTRRVLILGDSFAEGYYVEEPATARAVLEAILRDRCGAYEVLNGGTIAYSTDQEYLFYLLEGERYQPDLVLLFFYYNDLFYNSSPVGPGGEPKPYFVVEAGQPVLRNSPVPMLKQGQLNRQQPGRSAPKPWRGSIALRLLSNRTVDSSPSLHRVLARVGLVEPVSAEPPRELWPYGPGHRQEVDEMWLRTAALLQALRDATRSRGADFAVLYVPVRFEVNDEVWELTRRRYRWGPRWDRFAVFDRLKAVCERLGVPLTDPREALRRAESSGRPAYDTRDVHWTDVGNAVAAHALLPLVDRRLPCP